jgi:hypothetical protein
MQEPKLAPPGAGIPFIDRVSLRYVLLPLLFSSTSWEQALERFEKEGQRILKIISETPADKLDTRKLVPPMRGLEDSSRYWSVAMTVEHLIIVGEGIALGMKMLAAGQVPDRKANTAAVKPKGTIEAAQLYDTFKAFLDKFLNTVRNDLKNRQSKARYEHPWFGPLTAAQWGVVAAVHQRLHRQQMQSILSLLDVPH